MNNRTEGEKRISCLTAGIVGLAIVAGVSLGARELKKVDISTSCRPEPGIILKAGETLETRLQDGITGEITANIIEVCRESGQMEFVAGNVFKNLRTTEVITK